MDKIFNEEVKTTLNIVMDYVKEASKEYASKDLQTALNQNKLPQFVKGLIEKGDGFTLLYNDKEEAYRLYGNKNGEWEYVSKEKLGGEPNLYASMKYLIKDNFEGLLIETSDKTGDWEFLLNVNNNEILKITHEQKSKPSQVIEVATNREFTELIVEFSKGNNSNYADAYFMGVAEEDSEVLLDIITNNFGLPKAENLPF